MTTIWIKNKYNREEKYTQSYYFDKAEINENVTRIIINFEYYDFAKLNFLWQGLIINEIEAVIKFFQRCCKYAKNLEYLDINYDMLQEYDKFYCEQKENIGLENRYSILNSVINLIKTSSNLKYATLINANYDDRYFLNNLLITLNEKKDSIVGINFSHNSLKSRNPINNELVNILPQLKDFLIDNNTLKILNLRRTILSGDESILIGILDSAKKIQVLNLSKCHISIVAMLKLAELSNLKIIDFSEAILTDYNKNTNDCKEENLNAYVNALIKIIENNDLISLDISWLFNNPLKATKVKTGPWPDLDPEIENVFHRIIIALAGKKNLRSVEFGDTRMPTSIQNAVLEKLMSSEDINLQHLGLNGDKDYEQAIQTNYPNCHNSCKARSPLHRYYYKDGVDCETGSVRCPNENSLASINDPNAEHADLINSLLCSGMHVFPMELNRFNELIIKDDSTLLTSLEILQAGMMQNVSEVSLREHSNLCKIEQKACAILLL